MVNQCICVVQARFPQFAIPDVPEQEYDTKEKIDNSKAQKVLGSAAHAGCDHLHRWHCHAGPARYCPAPAQRGA